MSATSPLGAAGALGVALVTVLLMQRLFGPPLPARAFATLDGLRGYAAFLVFLHHAAIWFVFARTGVWALPPTRLYTHFGQSSVAIFFMITGFLFWSKLLDGQVRPIDWRRLLVSRVLRLTPLFLFFVALLGALTMGMSGFRLRVSAPRAALQTAQWLTFTIAGMPNINFAPTTIMGGAAWSLPYEWWFYGSLPLAGRLLGLRPTRRWLIGSVAWAAAGAWWVSSRGGWHIAAAFLGGIAAAVLLREPRVRTLVRHPVASVVCIGTLAAVTRFGTAFAPAPLLLLAIAFAIMAGGNTLFGALEWRAARALGDVGYSIYLLHGIVLFAAFGLMFGPAETAAVGANGHWLIVYACAVIITMVSSVTYRLIEAPGMASVNGVDALLAR